MRKTYLSMAIALLILTVFAAYAVAGGMCKGGMGKGAYGDKDKVTYYGEVYKSGDNYYFDYDGRTYTLYGEGWSDWEGKKVSATGYAEEYEGGWGFWADSIEEYKGS